MRKDLPHQFNYLDDAVERLNQPIVMLNVLHNRTNLDRLETCELEQILRGIEGLLQQQVNDIKTRIDVMLERESENA